jgi:hypothetical protein
MRDENAGPRVDRLPESLTQAFERTGLERERFAVAIDAPMNDDLDREEDRVEWRRRLAESSAARLASARARFERLGIIDAEGKLVSTELPPDMLPDSDTTLETG